jgi:GxxExxY protein
MDSMLDIDEGIRQLLRRIRIMAHEVFNELGRGYSESIYQRAICVELQMARIEYDLEVNINVPYKGHVVGNVRSDIVLRSSTPVIIETKTIRYFRQEERWQLSRYMKLLGVDIGMLINFNAEKPQVEIIVCCDSEYYVYNMKYRTGVLI